MHLGKVQRILVFVIFMKFLRFVVYGQFKPAASDTEMLDFSIRFKSVKCFVNYSRLKLHFCYVKAHSRTLTSLNIATTFLENFVGPSNVRSSPFK